MYSKDRQKIAALINYFNSVEIDENEVIKIDPVTTIVNIKEFINFSTNKLKLIDEVTFYNKPYIMRLHKLRLYYEQKQKPAQ